MKASKILMMGIFYMSLFGCFAESKEDAFWKWFSGNSSALLNSDGQNSPIIERLTLELQKVNSDLVYEMSGSKKGSVAEFTISADGKPELIPIVEKLYDRRPNLDNWNITAFRQRNDVVFNFEMNDIKITGNETRYLFVKDKDPKKLSILLFFPQFSEEKRNDYGGAAYIFMDGIIGEYDVMTKVGFIDVFGFDSEYAEHSHPISELIKEFDGYFEK